MSALKHSINVDFLFSNTATQLDRVEDVQKIVQEFEEMDADEYENSNPELKQIYITHALEVRRSRYLEKKRKQEEKTGYFLYVVVFVILYMYFI